MYYIWKEWKENIRGKGLWLACSVIIIVSISMLFQSSVLSYDQGFYVLMMNLFDTLVYFIPILSLFLGAFSVFQEKEQKTLIMLLTKQESFLSFLLKKSIGVQTVLIGPVIIWFFLYLLPVKFYFQPDLKGYFLFVLALTLLMLIFTQIGIFIGSVSRSRMQIVGFTIFIWFYFFFLHDFSLLSYLPNVTYENVKLFSLFFFFKSNPSCKNVFRIRSRRLLFRTHVKAAPIIYVDEASHFLNEQSPILDDRLILIRSFLSSQGGCGMIQITGLTQAYGKKLVLNQVNLTIEKDEICALVGRNGAGKSTLLHSLLGLLPVTKGTILINGHSQKKRRGNNEIAYLPEKFMLYPALTGMENMQFFARAVAKTVDEPKMEELLKSVRLWEDRNQAVKGYSKGMLQRLGLAITLYQDSSILILDEPTSGIDPMGRKEILEVLKTLSNKTILLSSHHLDEIKQVCTHVAFLENHQIQKYTVEQFLQLNS